MSLVFAVCGAEKNVGVTSLSLFLAQAFAEVTQKNSLVVDLDIKNPEIKEILENNNINNYNIDNIMTYATVERVNLKPVIKSNTTAFLNSSLNVIYGTNFREREFTDLQLSNFIQDVRDMYDFIVIDLGTSMISQAIINNSDMVFVVCPPSEKYIRGLKERKDYFNKKVEFILNMNSKGLNISKRFKSLYSKSFYTELPFSNTVQTNLNKGFVDFDGGQFQSSLYDFIYKILDRYALIGLISARFLFANDFFEKLSYHPKVAALWGSKKKTEKTIEERVKSVNNHKIAPKLGEILINLEFITQNQLEIALKKQEQIVESTEKTEKRNKYKEDR